MIVSKSTITRPKLKQKGERFVVTWAIGRQFRKRSFDKRADAEKQLSQCEKLVEAGCPDALLASPKALQIFSLFYQRFGERKMLELLEGASTGLEFTLLQDAADHYLAALEQASRSKVHIYTVRSHLYALSQTAGAVDVSQVTEWHIRTVLSWYESAKTQKNFLITFRSFFRYCIKQNWIVKSPAEVVLAPRIVRNAPEIYTPAELKPMLDGADRDVKLFILLCGFCGARAAESFRLTWDNLKSGHLEFPSSVTKTARRRVVRLEPNVAAALEEHRTTGNILIPEFELRIKMRELRDRVKFEWKHNGLRHSYVTYHLALYENPPLTSKNSGHTIRQMEVDYTNLTDKGTAESWFQIV